MNIASGMVGLVEGAAGIFGRMSSALAAAGPAASRFGTVGAVAGGVIGVADGIITGDEEKTLTSGAVTVGALAGAKGGALAGGAVGGPVGAAVGGVVGGLGGAAAGAAIASLPRDTQHSVALLSVEGQQQFSAILERLPTEVKPGMSPAMQSLVLANELANKAETPAQVKQSSYLLVSAYEQVLKNPELMAHIKAELDGKAPPSPPALSGLSPEMLQAILATQTVAITNDTTQTEAQANAPTNLPPQAAEAARAAGHTVNSQLPATTGQVAANDKTPIRPQENLGRA